MNLLTYAEASERYMAKRTKLQSLVSRGKVRAYRMGKRAVLSVEDLDLVLLESQIKPRKKVGRPRKGAVRI